MRACTLLRRIGAGGNRRIVIGGAALNGVQRFRRNPRRARWHRPAYRTESHGRFHQRCGGGVARIESIRSRPPCAPPRPAGVIGASTIVRQIPCRASVRERGRAIRPTAVELSIPAVRIRSRQRAVHASSRNLAHAVCRRRPSRGASVWKRARCRIPSG